ACCPVAEEGADVAPPRVLNTFVKTGFLLDPVVRIPAIPIGNWGGTAADVGGLESSRDRQHIVLAHQRQCRLVLEVAALVSNVLLLGALSRRLRVPLAAFLPAGDPLLGPASLRSTVR